MHTNYQGLTHKDRDTSKLPWLIADKVRDLQLQDEVTDRDQLCTHIIPDLRASGREKFSSSSLSTYNKKMEELKKGRPVTDKEDTIPSLSFGREQEVDEEDDSTE